MALQLKAFADADDVFLIWKTPPLPGCLGFAIGRETMAADGSVKRDVLRNRLCFAGEDAAPGSSNPSTIWPFQRYTWTDHSVDRGVTARYCVTPVFRQADASLAGDPGRSSGWTDWITCSGKGDGNAEVFFNRGIIMSQFIAREVGSPPTLQKIRAFKSTLQERENEFRILLGGNILEQLDGLLDETIADTSLQLYAALYELSDPDLIDKLKTIGRRAHVVLANGSDKSGDGNLQARQDLRAAQVDVHDRMLASRGLGHNKFALLEKGSSPHRLWTGSTNWAMTGLCTQINNALRVDIVSDADKALFAQYRGQWDALVSAGDTFPPELKSDNSVLRAAPDKSWNLWFTPTNGHADLQWVSDRIGAATQSILFLMFAPGTDGLLQPVLRAKENKPDLYVIGVINDENVSKTQGSGDARTTSRIDLIGADFRRQFPLTVFQPEGLEHPMANLVEEVTRQQFFGPSMQAPTVGHAAIHAKVLVIDAFTDHPVVITGSHNFSKSASEHNDENLLVIEGDRALARRYAVAINSVYEHFRFREYEHATGQAIDGLVTDDTWQARKQTRALAMQQAFWLAGAGG